MSELVARAFDAVEARTEDPYARVVDALCAANDEGGSRTQRRLALPKLPSRENVMRLLDDLRAVLYPAHFSGAELSRPSLRYYLGARLDPAARFIDETLLCYPGVTALTQHRIAHELYRLGVPIVPRMIAELSHATTGIDIHPGARVGTSFFIDHGTGVVIGETCTIGERVRIYQGVTLGARGFATDEDGHPLKGGHRHPVVEDDVVIYAGATILGRVTIGRGATIGGNVWLTRDVAPNEQVTQAQVRRERFGGGAGI